MVQAKELETVPAIPAAPPVRELNICDLCGAEFTDGEVTKDYAFCWRHREEV